MKKLETIRYFGRRPDGPGSGVVEVEVTEYATGAATTSPLSPRHDLRNHSPDGFEWGYNGSGPAQLALAILAHYLGDRSADLFYQDFKRALIAPIQGDEFELFDTEIDAWARSR